MTRSALSLRDRDGMTSRLGTIGACWAIAYVPIHVFWALGGTLAPFGIADPGPDWALANWAACVLIVGAGLICLSLTRRWGAVLPCVLRRRTALAAGGLALAHWAVFTVQLAVTGPDLWGWWNLLVFEPWFAVMGVLLFACARRAETDDVPVSRAGTAITLVGVVATVLGVVAFTPWLFLGIGPAVSLAGLVLARHTYGRRTSRPRSDVPTLAAAAR